jgi:CO/xanthine dehydrogenase FAD-binding subunit
VFARPGLPDFDYVRPETAEEVVRLLHEEGGAARLLMGGTDLFPNLRNGIFRPRLVIDVKALPGMRAVAFDPNRGLTVGAAVTMNELAQNQQVQTYYPLLAQAAVSVASYQIRNRATLGGNLCNASPCADTAPACLVMGAEMAVLGPSGNRLLPAVTFFQGPGRTALQRGEFLTTIHFPPPPPQGAARYLKLGRSRIGDLSLVGVAILGYLDGNGGGHHFRIGLGSVAPTAIRAVEAEAFLDAHPASEEGFGAAAERAMAASNPITDVRGTADYQRAMVRTLTLRGLREVWAQLTSE